MSVVRFSARSVLFALAVAWTAVATAQSPRPGCTALCDELTPPMVDPGDQAPVVDMTIAGSFGAASGPTAAVPGMLGDSYMTVGSLSYDIGGDGLRALIPYGGRYKCADNTGPIPTNRVSFQYKHFHNALQGQGFSGGVPDGTSNGHIDSYTLGIEKTFLDDWASLELRIPFYAGSLIDKSAGPSSFSSPTFGNLSFILKVLWSRSEDFAWGGGLGVDVPTAESVGGSSIGAGTYRYDQDAVYLAPFVAFLGTPNDNWWYQGVAQFSFVAGSNRASGDSGNGAFSGRWSEQDLVFVTLNAGAWLLRDPLQGTGVAAVTELNYTATLSDADVTVATDGFDFITLTNVANHQNVLNLTSGLHFQLTRRSNLRVAAVVPLRDGSSLDPLDRDRFFDAEVSVQFNRTW